MDLHQLQVIYHAADDRILLRASFKAEDGGLQEVRAWLTRRLLKNFWPGLVQSLATQVTLDKPQAAHASAEIVSMEHQASVAGSNFKTAYEDSAQTYPIGETPILVTAAHFTLDANQPMRINFTPDAGNGFEVVFTQSVLHGFCKLLQDAVKKAEWDIELRLPGATENVSGSRVLN